MSLGDGEQEEIMTYNEILNLVEDQLNQGDEDQAWTFDAILNHRKVNGKWEIQVLWTTGEETWEPLNWLADQDPITIAMYAKENKLLKKPGWKRFKNLRTRTGNTSGP